MHSAHTFFLKIILGNAQCNYRHDLGDPVSTLSRNTVTVITLLQSVIAVKITVVRYCVMSVCGDFYCNVHVHVGQLTIS